MPCLFLLQQLPLDVSEVGRGTPLHIPREKEACVQSRNEWNTWQSTLSQAPLGAH